MDPTKNPSSKKCDSVWFLAYKDGKVVGRIGGIYAPQSNKIWNEKQRLHAGRYGHWYWLNKWRSLFIRQCSITTI